MSGGSEGDGRELAVVIEEEAGSGRGFRSGCHLVELLRLGHLLVSPVLQLVRVGRNGHRVCIKLAKKIGQKLL